MITPTPAVEWSAGSGRRVSAPLAWTLPTLGVALPSVPAADLRRLTGMAISVVHEITQHRFEIRHRSLRVIRTGSHHSTGHAIDLSLIEPTSVPRRVTAVLVDGVESFDWFQGEDRLYPVAGSGLVRLFASCSPLTSASLVLEVDEGEYPPTEVLEATAYLLRQFALQFVGADECELPTNTTSVSRDGVSVQLSTDLVDSVPLLALVRTLYGEPRASYRLIDPEFCPVVAPLTSTSLDLPTRDLTIVIGDVASFEFRFVSALGPEDITGRSYEASIRTDSGTLVASFVASILDGPGGILRLTLSSLVTGALVVGSNVWDLEETNGAVVTTLFVGSRAYVVASSTE